MITTAHPVHNGVIIIEEYKKEGNNPGLRMKHALNSPENRCETYIEYDDYEDFLRVLSYQLEFKAKYEALNTEGKRNIEL